MRSVVKDNFNGKKMKKLKVGVVGVGYLGKFHAEKYAKIKGVDLAGVCDVSKKAAENVAQKVGCKPYADYKELMGKVDAASIVVPTPLHFNVCRDFLENGVDLLIEKPITTSLKEADELICLAESKGCIIQVGHLERYNPAIVKLKGIAEQPIFIDARRMSTFKGRGTDVSVVLDLMIHDIDIVLRFAGSKIKNIVAKGVVIASNHHDFATAHLEFENGCSANITAGRVSAKDERGMQLIEKDTYISVDSMNHKLSITKKILKPDMSPDMYDEKQAPCIENICCDKGDALEDEIRAFVESVNNRSTPEVSGQVGRDALKTALDIMEKIDKACGYSKV
jgi:predicted dehydrogenase